MEAVTQEPGLEDDEDLAMQARGEPVRMLDPRLNGKIIGVVSYKGGVTKTRNAIELAFLLGGILVDFEHDRGSASARLGYDYRKRAGAPIVEAIVKRRTPKPMKGGAYRPDFVPGHPDLASEQFAAQEVRDALVSWAQEWQRPVVPDGHPGGTEETRGIIGASDSIVSPVTPGEDEMRALEAMVEELAGYPILIIPSKWGRANPDAPRDWSKRTGVKPRTRAWLERIGQRDGVTIGPAVSDYNWIPERKGIAALTSQNPVAARIEPYDTEMRYVAKAVTEHVLAGQ